MTIYVKEGSAKFINGQGNWDQAVLREFLPGNVVDFILKTTPPRTLASEDSFSWKNNVDGLFTMKSVYLSIKQDYTSLVTANFDLVWKWHGLERVRLFL